MRTAITTVLAVLSVCGASVYGQDNDNCTDILRLLRTTARTVMSENSFASTMSRLCDEYERGSVSSESFLVDLRIVGIGWGGVDAANAETAYRNYCTEDTSEASNDMKYEQYLEGHSAWRPLHIQGLYGSQRQ